MPPKKSNLNNARIKKTRYQDDERAHLSVEQREKRNKAQRIDTDEIN